MHKEHCRESPSLYEVFQHHNIKVRQCSDLKALMNPIVIKDRLSFQKRIGLVTVRVQKQHLHASLSKGLAHFADLITVRLLSR